MRMQQNPSVMLSLAAAPNDLIDFLMVASEIAPVLCSSTPPPPPVDEAFLFEWLPVVVITERWQPNDVVVVVLRKSVRSDFFMAKSKLFFGVVVVVVVTMEVHNLDEINLNIFKKSHDICYNTMWRMFMAQNIVLIINLKLDDIGLREASHVGRFIFILHAARVQIITMNILRLGFFYYE